MCTDVHRSVKAEKYVVDSGATTHMTWDRGIYVTFIAMDDMPSVKLGDGRTVKPEGRGSVMLRVKDYRDAKRVIRLSSVLFVPDLSCNLFSVRSITDKGNRMLSDDITCSIIARGRPDADKWLQAAQDEMNSLVEHETWSLTKLPPGRKIIGSKWVFKLKHDENGEATRYKCRLVAQGYTQAQGIDYHETFAPVARFGSIRTLLATAKQRDMHIHQMDVHTAFLNGKLDEDINMCQLEGFIVKGQEDMVCHLQVSLRAEAVAEMLEQGAQQPSRDGSGRAKLTRVCTFSGRMVIST